MTQTVLTIGTRGSRLALWQAEWVKAQLIKHHPALAVELEVIKTSGDKILDVPLAKVGGKGLFVKEIEDALLSARIDIAVHSMKDMPAELPDGLCIAAVPERETPNDALISDVAQTLDALPEGAVIGTSSLRRASQLRHLRPDFDIVSLRGNLDTRIKKLKNGSFAAIILAAAGIKRLGLAETVAEYIAPEIMLPAVAQGALCIETRSDDTETRSIVSVLHHEKTAAAITAERAFLKRLEGGCQVPIAALAEIDDTASSLTITGLVSEVDGSKRFKETLSSPVADAVETGTRLADNLIEKGAGEIIERLIKEFENA